MFETKWGHYYVGRILSQTSNIVKFFCLLVFPLNWDRLGSHKIDQKIAQNLNFGEDFARNHGKTLFLHHFLHEKHLLGAPVLISNRPQTHNPQQQKDFLLCSRAVPIREREREQNDMSSRRDAAKTIQKHVETL